MSLSLSRFLLGTAILVSIAVGALFLAPSAAAQDVEAPAPEPTADLLASLDADGRFVTLAAALRQTGLDETIASGEPYTLFAPTDAAFEALGEGTLEALSDEELAAILLTHVVSGTVSGADVASQSELASLGGASLAVVPSEGALTVGGATVTEADVTIGAGTIHVVDAVLSADDAPDSDPDLDIDMSDTESAGDGDAM